MYYYGNVWSMKDEPTVMVGITKNKPCLVDDEGNRLTTSYRFDNLIDAVVWFWERVSNESKRV